jgi:hypothetical protein
MAITMRNMLFASLILVLAFVDGLPKLAASMARVIPFSEPQSTGHVTNETTSKGARSHLLLLRTQDGSHVGRNTGQANSSSVTNTKSNKSKDPLKELALLLLVIILIGIIAHWACGICCTCLFAVIAGWVAMHEYQREQRKRGYVASK